VVYRSEASSFAELFILQVDGIIIFDFVRAKGTVVLKHLRIEDECRLTGMEALILKHFLNVFNGVMKLDLKSDWFLIFSFCLYVDLVTSIIRRTSAD